MKNLDEMEYLNVGCGNILVKNAINMDVVENEVAIPDVVGNILDIPFPDGRFRGVICSHILEHLDKKQHPRALAEMRRVLVEGGKMFCEVPDMEQFMRNYLENYLGSKDYWYNGIYGRVLYESDRHLCGFSEQYLTDLLFENGFGKLSWAKSHRRIASLVVLAEKVERNYDTE